MIGITPHQFACKRVPVNRFFVPEFSSTLSNPRLDPFPDTVGVPKRGEFPE